jgi:hypothetical protein
LQPQASRTGVVHQGITTAAGKDLAEKGNREQADWTLKVIALAGEQIEQLDKEIAVELKGDGR